MKISINTATGKLHESQSHGDSETMIQNAERIGVIVEVRDIPDSELQSWVDAANGIKPESKIKDAIVLETQSRLDDFAKTRGYDGILSAATYASSTVPKFAQEGQDAVNLRDSTWAALYAILAEVTAGTRPMPTGFADIEPSLPVLAWSV